MNGIYYDCSINTSSKPGEKNALLKMIRDHNFPERSVITADRGYESYELMALCQESNQKYVIRVKDISSVGILKGLDFKGQTDIPVTRILTRLQTNKVKKNPKFYRYTPWKQSFYLMPLGGRTEYTLRFRVVQIPLGNGNLEYLVTNLMPEEFCTKELGELYHLRWNEEISFRQLKYTIDMISFHSRKRMLIMQEIYGSLILFNLCVHLIRAANKTEKQDERLRKEKRQKGAKHLRKTNFAATVTSVRKLLRSEITAEEVERRIKKYLVPIRPDRKYDRHHQPKKARCFQHKAS